MGYVPSQPVPVPVAGLGSLCGIPIVMAEATAAGGAESRYQVRFPSVLKKRAQYPASATFCARFLSVQFRTTNPELR